MKIVSSKALLGFHCIRGFSENCVKMLNLAQGSAIKEPSIVTISKNCILVNHIYLLGNKVF